MPATVPPGESLQWGHGDEAVEDDGLATGKGKNRKVLQWGHGDEAVEDLRPFFWLRATSWLQWGHGDEAVEDGGTILQFGVGAVTLQWGHGDEAVEDEYSGENDPAFIELQWGHGDEAVEDRSRRKLLQTPCFRVALRAVGVFASVQIVVRSDSRSKSMSKPDLWSARGTRTTNGVFFSVFKELSADSRRPTIFTIEALAESFSTASLHLRSTANNRDNAPIRMAKNVRSGRMGRILDR